MIKILSSLLLCSSIAASAQISVAAKANLLFPTGKPSWKNLTDSGAKAYEETGKNNVGYNVGLSFKIGLPKSLFVMPEVYYTSFKNEYNEPVYNENLEARSNRIDVPVLVGYNLLGENLGVFAGPVGSYMLVKDETFDDFKAEAPKSFTVGFQFGAQAQIRKLLVNARYEGAFTKDQRKFVNQYIADASYDVRYDNRPSLLILGLGYKF